MLELYRNVYEEKQTLGVLYLKKNGKVVFFCHTLELPWRNNQVDISCIPTGVYKCRKFYSKDLGHCIEVMDVPHRTLIRIHAGNKYTDIKGCIVVGLTAGDVNKDGIIDVTYSRNTLNKLLALLPDGIFELEIKDCIGGKK